MTSLELTFFQDLNGDGYIDTPTTTISVNGHVVLSNTLAQPAAIAAGATLELTAGASPLGLITFNGSTGTLFSIIHPHSAPTSPASPAPALGQARMFSI